MIASFDRGPAVKIFCWVTSPTLYCYRIGFVNDASKAPVALGNVEEIVLCRPLQSSPRRISQSLDDLADEAETSDEREHRW